LLERGRNGEAYNVCSGVERSLSSIPARLIELAGIDVQVQRDPARLRPTEQRRVCGSYEKLHRDTDWKPEISIDQSLTDILQDWKDKLS
jgi:GDP-4-dehydro-6-deoxy-D-mannose reductase